RVGRGRRARARDVRDLRRDRRHSPRSLSPRHPQATRRHTSSHPGREMKARDLRDRSTEDLAELERSLLADSFQNRFRNFTNRLDDTSIIKKSKRDLARVKLILAERARGITVVYKSPEIAAPKPKTRPPKEKAEAAETQAAEAETKEAPAKKKAP